MFSAIFDINLTSLLVLVTSCSEEVYIYIYIYIRWTVDLRLSMKAKKQPTDNHGKYIAGYMHNESPKVHIL